MELANHPYREGFVADEGSCSIDFDVISRPPRKSSLNSNFSYPKPDGYLRRHESSDSCSSLASNGSMPGMTDSSDSETSFEEDSSYNTSASELWDTFWPDSAFVPEEQYPVLLRASQTPNYFAKSFPKCEFNNEADDTITLSTLKRDSKEDSGKPCDTPLPRLSSPRQATRNVSPTYSVYPKPEPSSILRVALPPRTSSLNVVPLSPPRRQGLKSNISNLNIKPIQSSHSFRPYRAAPPVSKASMLPISAKSAPTSPNYPPPHPPRALRPATSTLNLRDGQSPLNQTRHNATAPLSPLSAVTPVEKPQSNPRPEFERLVSVFEFDSDHESYTERNSFTKRIARGFHKKSASEKRSSDDRRGSSDSQGSEKEKDKENPARKRGGSLGRILGLKSR
ncbi:hypothetical protein F4781DRAFT_195658 [Annulohypoxylon bovei var. microspora]|nr:hypothetical protein F4781DRAFT_195658 [Annulohypoxylon bovei var. microspora]